MIDIFHIFPAHVNLFVYNRLNVIWALSCLYIEIIFESDPYRYFLSFVNFVQQYSVVFIFEVDSEIFKINTVKLLLDLFLKSVIWVDSDDFVVSDIRFLIRGVWGRIVLVLFWGIRRHLFLLKALEGPMIWCHPFTVYYHTRVRCLWINSHIWLLI